MLSRKPCSTRMTPVTSETQEQAVWTLRRWAAQSRDMRRALAKTESKMRQQLSATHVDAYCLHTLLIRRHALQTQLDGLVTATHALTRALNRGITMTRPQPQQQIL